MQNINRLRFRAWEENKSNKKEKSQNKISYLRWLISFFWFYFILVNNVIPDKNQRQKEGTRWDKEKAAPKNISPNNSLSPDLHPRWNRLSVG